MIASLPKSGSAEAKAPARSPCLTGHASCAAACPGGTLARICYHVTDVTVSNSPREQETRDARCRSIEQGRKSSALTTSESGERTLSAHPLRAPCGSPPPRRDDALRDGEAFGPVRPMREHTRFPFCFKERTLAWTAGTWRRILANGRTPQGGKGS